MHRGVSEPCGASCRAIVLLVFLGASAFLERPAVGAPLDADAVVREAVSRNHDLKAARAQVDAALGRLKQAGLWSNPRLELSNETDKPFANEGEYSRSVGFSQDFPISGRLARAEDVARVDVARALAEVNEVERKLIGDVAAAFYDVAAIDQKQAIRDRLIGSLEGLVVASKARYKAGEVSELDVNAATLELLRLKQERTRLAGEREAAIRTLAGLSGYGVNDALPLDTKLPPLKEPSPAAQLITQAIERRPDLRLLALSADRADAERALASASAWEDWTVGLGVRRGRNVIEGAPPQPTDDALMMTLAIPVPLFNHNEGSKASAAAESNAAREQHTALSQRIENEIAGLRERAVRLLEAVTVYQQEALPLSRKNSETARNAYRSGQISIAEVVQAERQENEIGMTYAETLAQLLKSIADLDAASVAQIEIMTHPVTAADNKAGER